MDARARDTVDERLTFRPLFMPACGSRLVTLMTWYREMVLPIPIPLCSWVLLCTNFATEVKLRSSDHDQARRGSTDLGRYRTLAIGKSTTPGW